MLTSLETHMNQGWVLGAVYGGEWDVVVIVQGPVWSGMILQV